MKKIINFERHSKTTEDNKSKRNLQTVTNICLYVYFEKKMNQFTKHKNNTP